MSHDLRPPRLTLTLALELNKKPAVENEPPKTLYLACGFLPLHLATLLRAHARLRFPAAGIALQTGLFGDLIGSLDQRADHPEWEAAAVIEWADLDPRLGLRHSGGWAPSLFSDIETEVSRRLEHMGAALRRAGEHAVTVVCGPTLPMPPLGFTERAQDTAFELRLRAMVNKWLADLAAFGGIRVISESELAMASPFAERLDAGLALAAGFPYSIPHADAVARLLIEAAFPRQPKKALISDLDDTLWSGILGEVGVENVAWTLEGRAQPHGLYQQFLAGLAERGVLIGIASKNDAALVSKALARSDLLCPAPALFPIEAHWGVKSDSIARILDAWNIGAADVVFIDDSAVELAQVSAAFPAMTCLQFPAKSPQKVWNLLLDLRDLFGRQTIQQEDRLRVTSLRSASQIRKHAGSPSHDDFLLQLNGRILVDFTKDAGDSRAFELVNKTNQFNLNGRRWTSGEWQAMLRDPSTFLVTVSYEDKFGPLGKIAVAAGTVEDNLLRVNTWVMSCRAFSHRIEHQTLASMIARWSVDQILLDYEPTDRNGPIREFLESVLGATPEGSPVKLTASQFERRCPALPHAVTQGSDTLAWTK